MSDVEIEGYCPVAYFVADGPLKGSAEFSSTHEGKTYHLVSEDAKKAFDANPAKFVPAFSGSCAFGRSVNEIFPIDPTNYKIVNDRLFLFLKNEKTDALALWNDGNESELIVAADTNFSAAAA
ncbi:MAG: YHS domain-containing protein [Gammaproteobacteria bacterium]|nr:MAG: YHS domain-containing protein [Gammaproteobacteria bacterium]